MSTKNVSNCKTRAELEKEQKSISHRSMTKKKT